MSATNSITEASWLTRTVNQAQPAATNKLNVFINSISLISTNKKKSGGIKRGTEVANNINTHKL